MRDNLIKVIEVKPSSIDRKTHRAFESTQSINCGADKLRLNMSCREVSGSNAPSRWQRVKREKLAVMYALRVRAIAEYVQLYVRKGRHT